MPVGDGVGRQAWQGLHARAQQARDDRGRVHGVEKHVFVRRAQEALSVERVRGNGYVWKQGLQAMACGGGRCFQTGLHRPTEEVG